MRVEIEAVITSSSYRAADPSEQDKKRGHRSAPS
jgi:hypothetical protein